MTAHEAGALNAPPGDPGEAPAPCVLVVGPPHGGETSVAEALALAGISTAASSAGRAGEKDRAGRAVKRGSADASNLAHLRVAPQRSLARINEQLLEQLGGSWDRPPRLETGWERAESLSELRRLARAAFNGGFAGNEWPVAWADPCVSLLLPFWRDVIDRPLVGILSCREPIETAGDLVAAGRTGRSLGLALWDRYQRLAVEGLRGLPVFVSELGLARAGREKWAAELWGFLRGAGVKVSDPDPVELAALLDSLPAPGSGRRPGERGRGKQSSADQGALAMLPSLRALAVELERLAGAHDQFEPAPVAGADDWVSELLSARSDAGLAWDGLLRLAGALEEGGAATAAASLGVPPSVLQPRRAAREALPDGRPNGRRSYPASATEDRDGYHDWLRARGRQARLPSREEHLASPVELRASRPAPAGTPRFSIVVPVYRPPMWVLERCVASVLEQTEASFELCMCDDASGDEGLTEALRGFARLDGRIKVTSSPQNGGISAATNRAVALATGEFVVLLDNDDELAPHALEAMRRAIDAAPEADVLYSDEDKTNELGELFEPSFKPDWAPDTLLSSAYMCHLFVIRRSLLEELGGLRSDYDGSQDYDLMLRATEQARDVVHVPDVLYHWRVISGSAAGDTTAKPWAYAAGQRALEDALRRRGEEATVDGHTVIPGLYHVRRQVRDDPQVSIIVPFRDEPALLAQCVESVCEAPGYDRFELVLVDNGSVQPETARLLDQLAEHPRVVLVEDPGPFSWARINNDAVAAASGDLLLFMNNDVEATAEGWLLPMVEHAQRPDVGAVGARLLYPDRTIQHAGVAIGMCDGAGHVLQDLPEELPGYLAWAYMTRNCTAVTGACLMTRRDLFERMGGFAGELSVAFSDIDYCLRLREEGLLVVYTPLAELVHHESRTRGHTDDAKELPLFLTRWEAEILAGDPYHNPNLSRWRLWCPLSSQEDEELWKRFLSKLERLRAR